MIKKLRAAIALLFFTPAVRAEAIQSIKVAPPSRAWLPESALTQHAAYAGYVAAGFGWRWRDIWAVDLLYGYTPPELAGEAIHSATLKSLVFVGSMGSRETIKVRAYLGVSINYSPDRELFVRLPDQYPDGYYLPTAIRPGLVGGLEFHIQNQVAIGFEFVVLDSELAYWRKFDDFNPNTIGSSGLSVRWPL